MKRAEIHRRKIIADRMAVMMCIWEGNDPYRKTVVRVAGNRQVWKPLWEVIRPAARAYLAQVGWPDVQLGKEEDAQEKD